MYKLYTNYYNIYAQIYVPNLGQFMLYIYIYNITFLIQINSLKTNSK